ncbi:hypothetical protein ACFL0E_00200 [Nanoarchaeota archaeon]
MDFITLGIVLVVAVFVVFFGRILSHALKFVFYALLVLLVVVFIFGISFTDVISFVSSLIFSTF